MRVSIFANQDNTHEFINNYLNNSDIELVSEHPDVVITLGGDGTLLEAIHTYGLTPSYLPINWGSLGFLTSYEKIEFNIKQVDFNNVSKFDVLTAVINNQEYFFINECQLFSTSTTKEYKVEIDGQQLDYQASGMEIVSSLGTTGCSRANRGAIIAPHKKLFTINPIMPVNNAIYKTLDNPIVCDQEDHVSIMIDRSNRIIIDGQEIAILDNLNISIKVNDEQLKLIDSKIDSYYQRINEKILK